MGEPIEDILKKLLQNSVITLKYPKPYDPRQFKPSWWDDNTFCDYHHTKGHKTSSCRQLKNLVQDLIDNHTIEVGGPQFASNVDHTIHKNPLQDHGSNKASTSVLRQMIINPITLMLHTIILVELLLTTFELMMNMPILSLSKEHLNVTPLPKAEKLPSLVLLLLSNQKS